MRLLLLTVPALLMAAITATLWLMPYAVSATIAFGVRIPPDRHTDPAVLSATRGWRLRLVAGLILSLALLALTAGSAAALVWPPLVLLLLSVLNYLIARHQVQLAKQAGSWFSGVHEAVAATLDPDIGQGAFPWPYLLPALILLALILAIGAVRYPSLPPVIAIHFGLNGQPNGYAAKTWGSVLFPLWTGIFVTATITALSFFTFRSRRQLDPTRPEASLQQSWLFRARMMRLLLLLAAVVNLTLLLSGLVVWGLLPKGGPTPVLTVLIPLLMALVIIAISLRMGQEGVRIPVHPAPATGLAPRDDDRYWKGGLLYWNPKDPAIIVPKRFGIGWTFNFGHPVSWLVLVVLVAAPLTLRWLIHPATGYVP